MIYQAQITLPANTPRSDPVEQEIIIHPGTLTQVDLEFPDGCAGLARLQILHWDVLLFPSNRDGFFSGDGSYISFSEEITFDEAPYTLTIRGWNLDDTFPHSPIVRLGILNKMAASSMIQELLLGPRRG